MSRFRIDLVVIVSGSKPIVVDLCFNDFVVDAGKIMDIPRVIMLIVGTLFITITRMV